jgi:hypothetical protein
MPTKTKTGYLTRLSKFCTIGLISFEGIFMTASRSSGRVGKVDVGGDVEKKDVGGRVVEPLAPVNASSSGIKMLAQAKLSVGRVDDLAELEADEGNAIRSADAIINRQKSARPTMMERLRLAEQAQQANVRYLEGSSGSSSTDSNADLGADLGTDSNTDSDYEELWNASGESSQNYAPPRPTGPKPSLAPPRPTGPKPSLAPDRPTGPKPDLAPDRPTGPKPSFAPPRPTGPKPSFGGPAAESAYEVPVANPNYVSSRAQEHIYEEIPDHVYEDPDNVRPKWDPSVYSTTAAAGGNAAESAYEVPVGNSKYSSSRAQDHVYEYEDPNHIYEDPDNVRPKWDPSVYSTTAAAGGNAAESAYEVPVPNSTYAASRQNENIYEDIPDNIYEEIPDNASGASRSSSGGGYSQFGVDNSPIYEQPVVREEPIYEEPVVRNEPKKQKSKKPGVFGRMKNWFK